MIGRIQADKPGKCHKRVYGAGAFTSHQCTRNIKNTEGEYGYCTQHTPSIRKAKADARYEEYLATNARRNRKIGTKNALLIAVLRAESYTLPKDVINARREYMLVRELT